MSLYLLPQVLKKERYDEVFWFPNALHSSNSQSHAGDSAVGLIYKSIAPIVYTAYDLTAMPLPTSSESESSRSVSTPDLS